MNLKSVVEILKKRMNDNEIIKCSGVRSDIFNEKFELNDIFNDSLGKSIYFKLYVTLTPQEIDTLNPNKGSIFK